MSLDSFQEKKFEKEIGKVYGEDFVNKIKTLPNEIELFNPGCGE